MTAHTRPYRSTLRDEQARTTRRRIVDAGRDLFVERGYGPTTVDAIADRAGVSRKTVFTSVGSKVAVLTLAFDWALAGDDEPVAIADRPQVRRMMQGRDPAALLDGWISMNAAIAERLAPLYQVLVVAADADAEAAALLSTVERRRTDGAREFVSRLQAIRGLRSDRDVDRATAIADLLMDPLFPRRLVEQHGWTSSELTAFLRELAATALLTRVGSPSGRRARGRTPHEADG
jgi:AcrR family transcriptional regulator